MIGWTYGVEHEFADWPQDRPLPSGYGMDKLDFTLVNSNGIAVDPLGVLYRFGGEINTPPTDDIWGQVDCLEEILKKFPEVSVNYRSNLHIHIRAPELENDLELVKRVHTWTQKHFKAAMELVEPIPAPIRADRVREDYQYTYEEWMAGARRRYNRRRRSHQSVPTPGQLAAQMKATTYHDFHYCVAPIEAKTGNRLLRIVPRWGVNMRHLMAEVPTIEFRHFPGTLNSRELEHCLRWCQEYLWAAINNDDFLALRSRFSPGDFPKFPPYTHWMEKRYRATARLKHSDRGLLAANVKAILEGTFDENSCSVSR